MSFDKAEVVLFFYLNPDWHVLNISLLSKEQLSWDSKTFSMIFETAVK